MASHLTTFVHLIRHAGQGVGREIPLVWVVTSSSTLFPKSIVILDTCMTSRYKTALPMLGIAWLIQPGQCKWGGLSFQFTFGKCAKKISYLEQEKSWLFSLILSDGGRGDRQVSPFLAYFQGLGHRVPCSAIANSKSTQSRCSLQNTPLSTLISSNQDCQYTIDTKKKQVSEAVCTEKHLFLPFSYK